MIGDWIRGYERDAERLYARVARLSQGFWSGRTLDGSAEAAYRGCRRLLGDRAVERLRAAAERSDGGHSRRARALLGFVVQSRIDRRRLRVDAEIARVAAVALVRTDRGRVPLGLVREAIAAEPDHHRRLALDRARAVLIAERLDPLHLEARALRRDELGRLGYSGDRDLAERLSAIDLEQLADLARAFIARTGPAVRDAIAAASEFGQLDRDPVHAADLTRLLRTLVPAPSRAVSLGEIYTRTLAGLGIDASRQRNVRVDLAKRPGKSPRPFCAAPLVPGEIHLVLRPTGAWDDVGALLHEAGHAQHFAGADLGAPAAVRLFGDRAITESWAFLFEGLAAEPEWLRTCAEIERAEPFVRHHLLRTLLAVRRYCALLLYELELDSVGCDQPLDPVRLRYAELCSRALTVEAGGGEWLAGLDPGFHSARYVRGWMLASGWRRELRDRFGAGWFTEPAAGRWLRAIWRQGDGLDASGLSASMLGSPLGFGPVEAELLSARL